MIPVPASTRVLAGGRRHRHAQGVQRAGGVGREGAGKGFLFGPSAGVPWLSGAVFQVEGSLIAEEAIKRIAGLYAIEKEGRGRPTDERVRLRQARAKPIVDDLESWLHAQLPKISGKSELAKAIRYGLARMRKLRPYLDHGSLEADNNGAEKALKPVALGRKNFLFVGSDELAT